ncbi:MAG TPA: DUF4396 domain-containing protein [Rudaea sp.]|nr:DUF4396 domain-containing protein [Rudaea sp.]
MPLWLHAISRISLTLALPCAVLIVIDLLRGHRQQMWIMNLVWPITALYSGPLALWAYFTVGRLSTQARVRAAKMRGVDPPGQRKPFWQSIGLATTHCGSGCTLGDLVAESALVFMPLTLFGHKIFAAWVVDFVLAFLFGIAFQYFTIKPMRDIGPREALVASLKADTLSLCAWQVGMYGWMAIATFAIFGHELDKSGPVFWFMMQVAMLIGFATAYPVNAWLLKAKIKEVM